MTAPVLIIAAADDWPTDRIVVELQQRGVEVFRMDTADFPQRIALTATIDQASAWTGVLTTEHRTTDLSRVGAVYYRAPGAFRFPERMSGPEERFAAAQARAGLGGVLSALECRWVNHPTAMARAEYKPAQLAAARACGLTIPATLITNSPSDVRAFAENAGTWVVCKPVASPVLIEDGQLKAVYTQRLAKADLDDLRGISATAHLFQTWVSKEYEVRLTMVGGADAGRRYPRRQRSGTRGLAQRLRILDLHHHHGARARRRRHAAPDAAAAPELRRGRLHREPRRTMDVP
jgi:glutathione synthase/RimK-type ligase-like ATP-grasp enzyme